LRRPGLAFLVVLAVVFASLTKERKKIAGRLLFLYFFAPAASFLSTAGSGGDSDSLNDRRTAKLFSHPRRRWRREWTVR
jgi:hypothetical protein